MTPAEETLNDTRNRLEHAVGEAREKADRSPSDRSAQGELEMAIAIRDAGKRALLEAEGNLRRSLES